MSEAFLRVDFKEVLVGHMRLILEFYKKSLGLFTRWTTFLSVCLSGQSSWLGMWVLGMCGPTWHKKGVEGVGGDRGQFILAILPIMNCRCAWYNESRLLLFWVPSIFCISICTVAYLASSLYCHGTWKLETPRQGPRLTLGVGALQCALPPWRRFFIGEHNPTGFTFGFNKEGAVPLNKF